MEIYLICLAAALVGGLMLSRVTKLFNLPAVTGYLVAGLLLGPFCLGRLGLPGLGFNSLHQVENLSIVTQTALLVFRLICCKVFNTMINKALQQRNPETARFQSTSIN